MATERNHDAVPTTTGGEDKPVVLPYASPGSRPPRDGDLPHGATIGVITFALFFIAMCANGPQAAIFVLVLGAMVYVGVRMAVDGHRPAWLALTVALVAGVAISAIAVTDGNGRASQ